MPFHPIRKTKRMLRTTKRKVAALAMVLAGTGSGSAVVAPDSVPAQLSGDTVRVVHHVVNKIVGPDN